MPSIANYPDLPVTVAHLTQIGIMKPSKPSCTADAPKKASEQPKKAEQPKKEKKDQAPKKEEAPKKAAKEEPKKADAAPAAAAPTGPSPFAATPAQPCEVLYMQGLDWTEIFEQEGSALTEVMTVGDDVYVTLDKTIFHAQGGGQPTDVGLIKLQDGSGQLEVVMVKNDKESGKVLHQCKKPAGALPSAGAKVNLSVDPEVRMNSAKLHSAGHLLDAGVRDCGHKWLPSKGYHFSDGPYVEYKIDVADRPNINAEKDSICAALTDACAKLQAADAPIELKLVNGVRYMDFAGVAGPCGGTHVDKAAKIGPIQITKLACKKDTCKVSYKLIAA